MRKLNLFGNQITSESLSQITHLEHLKILKLQESPIDDMAVEYITQLKELSELNVGKTEMSVDGVERIRTALPGCKITDR